MAKDVGAKKVIVASCAPPIRSVKPLPPPTHTLLKYSFPSDHRYSNVYGIDMPSRAELVAHNRTTEAIATAIGADLVIFQTLPDLISSVRQFNPAIERFDTSVFTGEYVTGGVDEVYLSHLESLRADNAKKKGLGGEGSNGVGEGKGGGSLGESRSAVNGHGHSTTLDGPQTVIVGSGPMNGDDTIGLHNSWHAS